MTEENYLKTLFQLMFLSDRYIYNTEKNNTSSIQSMIRYSRLQLNNLMVLSFL